MKPGSDLGSGIEHGTSRGYRQHLYRHEKACEDCRVANNRESKAYRTLLPFKTDVNLEFEHGTSTGYQRHINLKIPICDLCRRSEAEVRLTRKIAKAARLQEIRRRNGVPDLPLPKRYRTTRRVPIEVLIASDVIDIKLPGSKRTARAVIEQINEKPDGTVDLALALETDRTSKARTTLNPYRAEQGLRLVPAEERLAAQ